MFKEGVDKLSKALNQVIKEKVDLNTRSDQKKIIADFTKSREFYTIQSFEKALNEVRSTSLELTSLKDPKLSRLRDELLDLANKLESKDKFELQKTVNRMLVLSSQLPAETAMGSEIVFALPKRIPAEIAADFAADMEELEKCYYHGCYRSAIILCGRLLETALHRKYYEVTDFDILEKNPGIGLGNLIAKLAEKNVQLEPGLTQQIHLINQVRIFSVHKKKEAFLPSKEQTQAIILYTIDSLKKIFK